MREPFDLLEHACPDDTKHVARVDENAFDECDDVVVVEVDTDTAAVAVAEDTPAAIVADTAISDAEYDT